MTGLWEGNCFQRTSNQTSNQDYSAEGNPCFHMMIEWVETKPCGANVALEENCDTKRHTLKL